MADIKFVRYCRNCNRPMFLNAENKNQMFCSDECSEEYTYSKMNHPIDNACERCGKVSDDLVCYNIPGGSVKLCESCSKKFEDQIRDMRSEFTGIDNFEIAAKHILMGLQDMGFDTDADNFKDTPKRFARAYCEIFSGCKNTDEQVKAILNTSFPSQGSENMVVAKDIVCFSACPHHLLPVEYHVCVGYIPSKGGDVLGISKLARLVTVLAKRPSLQETFTQEIVDYLGPESIKSMGAIAYVEGQHMCMRMRGAKATNTTITTTSVSGYFLDNASTKQEFMSNIEDRLRFRG